MNVIIAVLLLGLIGTIWVQWWLSNRKKNSVAEVPAPKENKHEDNLAKLVEIMRLDREEKAREQRDKELLDYARQRRKDQPPVPMQSSLLHEDGPVKGGDDAIPFGLSALDKDILREFYRKD